MSDDNWEDLYVRAAKEVDSERVPEQVEAAKDAIRTRLRELDGNGKDREERIRLASTLAQLDSLATDAEKW